MSDPVEQLVRALDATQWMPSETFNPYQQRLLGKMLIHAHAQTDRYRRILEPVFQDGPPDLSRWHEIPFLTRAEAQADPASITARTVPPEAGDSNQAATSGSTARAFAHLRSDFMMWLNAALTERGHGWFDVDFSGTMASIAAYENDAANTGDGDVRPGGWGAGGKTGIYAMLGIQGGSAVQNMWLDTLQPDYLTTYPSIAAALAETSHGRRWPETLKTIFCIGETLTDEQRRIITDATNATVANTYGASETGLLAFECPHSGMMHVLAEAAIVEIVKTDGNPADPGEIGEIAVTSLANFAMPFIRYKIGDFAEVADQPCSCGRTLPVLRRIMGRSRNMFRRPDGAYIWPNVLSRVFNEFIPHRQFRFIQKTPTAVELIYVPQLADQTEDRAAMLAYARERLFPEVELIFTRAADIARLGRGKFEDYIREID